MQASLTYVKIGLLAAGIVIAGLWLVTGGPSASKGSVQIEFGTDPERFEGLEVQIDGRSVGRLARVGETARTGFEVAPGHHVVRVVGGPYACEPREIEVRSPEDTVRLLLDHAGEGGVDGRLTLY